MVQEYLNEIAPTLHGPNKLKTSGKPLGIADNQTPASGQDNPATLYLLDIRRDWDQSRTAMRCLKTTLYSHLESFNIIPFPIATNLLFCIKGINN